MLTKVMETNIEDCSDPLTVRMREKGEGGLQWKIVTYRTKQVVGEHIDRREAGRLARAHNAKLSD